jgi:hypothetical protein
LIDGVGRWRGLPRHSRARPILSVRRTWPPAETTIVKVCPHCAEELPEEATACSVCGKDPAAVPAWAERAADHRSPPRLDDVFEPSGVLPTAPHKSVERPGSLGIPSKVWMSLILAFGWRVVYVALLPLTWGLFLGPLGYVVGLILGISGKGEVQASDRLGRILATLAIIFNAINLVWSVLGTGMALRGFA